MAERNGSLRVPRWVLGAVVTIVFGSFVTWAIGDRVGINRDMVDLRERVVRLETLHDIREVP